jgi:flagellar biosynthesis/type III secretory pathway chaperone
MKMQTQINQAAERLLEGLRSELQEYGAMLALLDQQQQAVVTRAADDVLQSVNVVNAQTAVIEQARELRETRRREAAALLAQPAEVTFADLTPRLPQKFHAAINALVRENNQLLIRVRQRARQNHLLITRSLELMQRVLNAFVPAAQPTTYTGAGKTSESRPPALPLYDAVG